ncbi:MAG TPA: adenylate/guanylate cyclase domain-containing protein [Acidimicrobiales bacterium]|nr:adenylate/guanylate cyclase domain-containing protein [Acidimicrobiales bacterium]
MGEAQANRELFDRVGRRLTTRIPLAHLIGAALATASGVLTSNSIRGQPGFGWIDITLLSIYLPVAGLAGTWWAGRIGRRAWDWVLHDRAPTEAEQKAGLAVPWRLAGVSMTGWLGAAVLWSGVSSLGHGAAYVARVALSILLGGLSTSGFTYLLAEWTIRPLVAAAFAYQAPERALMPGVRAKLLLSWVVGADVYLIMIALTFVGRPAHQPPSASVVWFIAGAGLLAGTVVFYSTTRSLAAPLMELRQALSRVQRGDLGVAVSIDDGSEIGLLQAGFNHMVGGLRERRALQDLFGRHVGAEVANLALERGVALGGERRDVGVIFIDLINSTGLTVGRSPEAVVELLNRFFGTVVRVISNEGGWVNKFEGDGAVCVFGAPIGTEDHATRALRAARTLRRELLALGAVSPELDAAIGVSAGPAVAGNIGAEQRYEYTVIGAPVNEAARLTDEAKQRLGRVLASEEALTRAGDEAGAWLVADEIQLRGFSHPTLVYEPSERVPAHRNV